MANTFKSNTGSTALDENVQIARECALLGNYEASLVFYEGALQAIQAHVNAEAEMGERNIKHLLDQVQAEQQMVKKLQAELMSFQSTILIRQNPSRRNVVSGFGSDNMDSLTVDDTIDFAATLRQDYPRREQHKGKSVVYKVSV